MNSSRQQHPRLSIPMIESKYFGGSRSGDVSPRPVEVDYVITLFPWVDAIETQFVERVQPLWLTNKDQIVGDVIGYLRLKYSFQGQALYVMFWGAFTTAILLYFCTKQSSYQGGLLYYFGVLVAWNLLTAALVFFYFKVGSATQASDSTMISITQHISMISYSYAVSQLPMILAACNMGFLRILFSLINLLTLTFFVSRNYINHRKSPLTESIVVYVLVGLCSALQTYFLSFYFRDSPVMLPPRHNLHVSHW